MSKKLKAENEKLRDIIKDMQWMARRYAHGRMSYAVDMYNCAVRDAQALGVELWPDPIDGLIEAKDAMLDRAWFEARGESWAAADREATGDVLHERDRMRAALEKIADVTSAHDTGRSVSYADWELRLIARAALR
jgi:hypothetical protein